MISVFAGWAPGVVVCFGVPLMLIAALVLRVARGAVIEWIAFTFLALTAIAIIALLVVSALDNWLLWLLVGPLAVITGWGLLTGYRQKFGSRPAD